eukprot:jgi/Mesvir1/3364/Mv04257-RA.2
MAELSATFACAPATVRARGVMLGGHGDRITYSNGKCIIIRNLTDPRKCDIYSEHGFPATVARFSPNGEWVASGDANGTVKVWAAGEGHTLKYECRALGGSIDDLQWSADGQRIVACGDGKGGVFVRAFMWDSGSTVGEFTGHSKRVNSCDVRPTRPFRVVTAAEDFKANVYEGPPFRYKTGLADHTNFVNCVRFSPDGAKFLTVSSDKKGIIFDANSYEKVATLDGHGGSIFACSWAPGGAQAITASGDKTVKLWDIATATCVTTFTAGSAVEDMQQGCIWLGNHIISLSLSGDLNFWDPKSPGGPVRVVGGHTKYVTTLAHAGPGKSTLFSSSYDGIVHRWDVAKGVWLGRVAGKGHSNSVVGMQVDPASHTLWTVSMDDSLRSTLLPAEAYSDAEATKMGRTPRDLTLALGTDLCVVASADGLILVKGGKVASTTPCKHDATCAALAPGGTEVAAGGADGGVYVYSVEGDTLVLQKKLEQHRAGVTCVRYSPNGALIASGDQNREVVIWDRIKQEVGGVRCVTASSRR